MANGKIISLALCCELVYGRARLDICCLKPWIGLRKSLVNNAIYIVPVGSKIDF